MADSKKGHFPSPPILNIFFRNFHGWVLGLVGLIDAKGIDGTQPIWRTLLIAEILSGKNVRAWVSMDFT
jgi:hypothetical protein